MNCQRVYQNCFLLVDNEDAEICSALLQHLAICPECARRVENARKLVLVVRQRCQRQVAPERLRIRIQARLRSFDT